MKPTWLMISAGLLLTGMTGSPAQAQSVADFYRGKTVNVLIGVGVGGEYDLQARLVGDELSGGEERSSLPSARMTR